MLSKKTFTDTLLDDASLQEGQHILDIGCAVGNLTLDIAKLIGPDGHVVGIDRNEKFLEMAREKAEQNGLKNVTFLRRDIYDLAYKEEFDVVTCRRVLMYLPDAVSAVEKMLSALRPKGQLILQEHNLGQLQKSGSTPLNEEVLQILRKTLLSENADIEIGLKLDSILTKAGAGERFIQAQSCLQTPHQIVPLGMILKAIQDRIIACGAASQDKLNALDLDTLDDRMMLERKKNEISYVCEVIFGAIAAKE